MTTSNERGVEKFARELANEETKLGRELLFHNRAYKKTSLELYISPLPRGELFSLFQERSEALRPYYEACQVYKAEHPVDHDSYHQWFKQYMAEVHHKFERNFRKVSDIDGLVKDKRKEMHRDLTSLFKDVMRQVVDEESSERFVGRIDVQGEKQINYPKEFHQFLNEGQDLERYVSFEIWRIPPIDEEGRIDHVNAKGVLAPQTNLKYKDLKYREDDDETVFCFSPMLFKIKLEPVPESSWYHEGKKDFVQCYRDVIESAYVGIIQSALKQIMADYGNRIIPPEEFEGIKKEKDELTK